MNRIIVRAGIVLAILAALGSLQGCFEWQRAWGCSDPGILGCKDEMPEPSEITPPPAGLKRAPPGGRAQQAPVGDGRYLEGHDYPWSRPLDDCMAAGGTRPECFASLPPDILEQFEAWEAERGTQRRRSFLWRSGQPSFGFEPVDPEEGTGFIFRGPRYRQAPFSGRCTEKIDPVPFYEEYCYPHD
jgi:hypothetical protein